MQQVEQVYEGSLKNRVDGHYLWNADERLCGGGPERWAVEERGRTDGIRID
jgi:hypothetical protein